MPVNLLALFVFAIVMLLFLIRRVYRLWLVSLEKAWLPQEVQSTALAYAERVFRARSLVPPPSAGAFVLHRSPGFGVS